MNKAEARRFAHKLASEAIQQISTKTYGADGPTIMSALADLAEQHRRFGPKTTDREPNIVEPHSTPLFSELEKGDDV